ncbi:hypothetical protein BDF22DRAFT_774373 [Syncephalis plumigaleata]|nr:hypothetical protein BDF22DRAFT_774373 [Syncephalis plumigaleata]
MPIDHFSSSETLAWKQDAEKLWGIPLHPLGEVNFLDYFAGLSGSMLDQRARLFCIQESLVVSMIMCHVFAYNSIISSKMVISRPEVMPSWCCFISSITGLIVSVMAIMSDMGVLINCRIIIWAIGCGTTIASLCNSTIFAQKAYIVLDKQRWIIYISIPLMLIQLSFPAVLMLYTFSKVDQELGCVFYYPYGFIWCWTGINAPLNTFFSALFCSTAYKEYRKYGSDTWKQLAQDGIQTITLALLCNIIFTILVALQLEIIRPDYYYPMDWMIVNTILVRHCRNMRNKRKKQSSNYISIKVGLAIKKTSELFIHK